ncbi:hypothetical protein SAMN05421823_102178 [Catalinimonas alkaloidigena]|uniref:Major facilitator superfamily (MFS) profile domain-containing protein n=1 Tax=Catalinimonas alkaloidigena TaxID=1075417 RepID=A0A1G9A4G7_9BACT|nr:DUF6069 family protein [Catalinimonas alkaloidigena]SDK22167.1 hypothetical protein SAMN05421823_102178 [Catalinimonas alkaloidigena]
MMKMILSLDTHVSASRKLLWAAPLAGVVAAVLNGMLFSVASFLAWIPADFLMPTTGEAFGLGPVMVSSFLPSLGAGLVLALLSRFSERPLFVFSVLAGGVLAGSFISPLGIGAPVRMIAVLEVMHVLAAVTIVGGLRYALTHR